MPDLRLVSDQSSQEIERKRTEENIEHAMCLLAANLLRVIRGAGKPEELPGQMQEVLAGMSQFRELCGFWPPPAVLTRAFDLSHSNRTDEWDDAERDIMRGSLQMVASSLVGELTQRRAGHREMFEGLVAIERIRENNRHQRQATTSARAKPARRKRKKKNIIL